MASKQSADSKPVTQAELPQVGRRAPAFSLSDAQGNTVKLSGFRGRIVVLYFYPKDNTPGCTRQAAAFQEHLPTLQKLGAEVVGVSPDTAKSHARFSEKLGLGLTLLADEDHRTAEAYGVWREKKLYGRTFMGIVRSTFLIGGDGKILHTWTKVKPDGHAQEVIEALRALS